MGRRFGLCLGCLLLSIALELTLPASAAHAATVRYVAPGGPNTGDCTITPCGSVQYAIDVSADRDMIMIAAGTYVEQLEFQYIVLYRSLSLIGAGAGATILQGSGVVAPVISICRFNCGPGSRPLRATIEGMTIQGSVTFPGVETAAGVDAVNQVTIRDATISGNQGGGVSNGGGGARNTMILQRVTITDNQGPGISNYATMMVSRNEITDNSYVIPSQTFDALGGGIYNAGTLQLVASTVSGNIARGGNGLGPICAPPPPCHWHGPQPGGAGRGGGIYNVGVATIKGSTISDNSAEGGDGGPGGSPMNYSGAAGGEASGGGIYGGALLINSTVSGNRSVGGDGGNGLGNAGGQGGPALGGGVNGTLTETWTNTTIADNVATGGGGGAGNPPGASGVGSGGGIDQLGPATLVNTILAQNSADSGPDCLGTITSNGHNLLGSDSGCSGFNGTGDLVNADPFLGPLQDNGGPTFTMALLVGSPAIDAADDGVCQQPPVSGRDQRAVPRPQGPHCDIGSYEKQ